MIGVRVYDANNNRIIKEIQQGSIIGKQYYIRDAQGNVLASYSYDGSSLKWAEQDLYGSSRVGLWSWNKTIPTRVMLPQSETDTLTNWYLLGSRYYELTNHLGNVLSVITDKKKGVSLDSATVDHYQAEVLSQNDYYPFGMEQPGRSFRTIPYPYAFNGKRMENVELSITNIYDYGMRSYDARIGRFYSVDPLTGKYPFYSPYQFAGNTPIQAVDLDGEEVDFSKAKINKLKYTRGSVWNPISNAKKVGIFIDNSIISGYNSVIDATELSYNYIFYHKQTNETVQKNLWNGIFRGLIYLGNTTSKQRLQDVKNYAEQKATDINTYENLVGQLMIARGLGILEEKAVGEVAEMGTARKIRFTQKTANDLVIELKKQYGGNVTVMEDGNPVFRVHQPGTHGNANATITNFSSHTNPQTGVSYLRPDSKVTPFDQKSFDILNQAIKGQGGYSIKTKGGR